MTAEEEEKKLLLVFGCWLEDVSPFFFLGCDNGRYSVIISLWLTRGGPATATTHNNLPALTCEGPPWQEAVNIMIRPPPLLSSRVLSITFKRLGK